MSIERYRLASAAAEPTSNGAPTRSRSVSASPRALSALIRRIIVAGSGKQTEDSFELSELIATQFCQIHCLDRTARGPECRMLASLECKYGAAAIAGRSSFRLAFGYPPEKMIPALFGVISAVGAWSPDQPSVEAINRSR